MSQVQEVRSVIHTKCCDHPGREETSIWPGPSKESAWKIRLCWVLRAWVDKKDIIFRPFLGI